MPIAWDEMTETTDTAGTLLEAPAWRRRVARAIDLAIVAVVFALFLTPIVAAHAHGESISWLLGASAWVYVGVFVVLAAVWTAGRNRRPERRPYITAGMSIMALYPLRDGRATRLVCSRGLPKAEGEKWGRAAVAILVPLLLAGAVFLVIELVAYA